MQRKTKKGFTIVELVIVIAVIGVLTAILVPTFISLNAKANKASDQSLVANLNTALKMQEAEDGEKNPTMHDAVLDLEKQGYKLSQLVSKSKEDLVYSLKENKFYLTDSSEVKNSSKKYEFWKIYEDTPALADQTFSIYAGHAWKTTSTATEPKVKVGFDAGIREEITKVDYANDGAGQEVVIRTNGGNLTINAASDKVYHYGKADALDIIAVASSSYHENGSVGYAKIATGRLVVEETANIDGIYLVANEEGEFDGIKLAVVGEAQLPELARADVNLTDGQSKLVVEVQTLQTSEGTDDNPEYVWISKSGSEVNAVVSSSADASDYSSHVVENPSQSAAAAKEETAQSATPISDDSVARVGAVGYQSLQNAINSAKENATVVLLKDISNLTPSVSITGESNQYCVGITKSMVLEGNNHTISLKSNETSNRFRGFGVKGTSNNYLNVAINNLIITQSGTISGLSNSNTIHVFDTRGFVDGISFNNVDLSTNELYGQPFTIGGSQTKTTNVTIIDSKITGANDKASYAITAFNPINMTIEGSEITGWSCLNLKAPSGSTGSRGSVINVNKSVFNCVNPYTGESNNYGAIKFEDTGGTAASVEITNTVINLTSWQGKYEAIAAFDNSSKGKVTLGNGVIMNSFGPSGATPIATSTSSTKVVTIIGGTYSVDPTAYVDLDNYNVVEDNGVWTVSKK